MLNEKRKRTPVDSVDFFRRNRKTIIFLFIFINISVISALMLPDSQEEFDRLVADKEQYLSGHIVMSMAIGFVIVVLECVLPIPSAFIYALAGIVFGPIRGGILVLAANIVGTWLTYIIGKGLFRLRVSKKEDAFINTYINKYGTIGIFLLRINPFTSSDFVTYVAGSLNMKMRKVMISTTLGIAPLIFFQTFTGPALISLLY